MLACLCVVVVVVVAAFAYTCLSCEDIAKLQQHRPGPSALICHTARRDLASRFYSKVSEAYSK